MRDFTLEEVVKVISKDYPYVPEKVIKHICKHAFKKIISIMSKGKAQIRLQHADIHSIYQEIDVSAIFADLDESRFLNKEESQLAKAQELAGKGIYTTRKRGRGKVTRIYNTRPVAHPVHAGQHTEGSICDVRESEQCREEVQSISSEVRE
jgi:hypothetical protein